MRKVVVTAIVFLLVFSTVSLVACSSCETVEGTFNVGSSPAIDIQVGNGDIEVTVSEDGKISTTAHLRNPDSVEYSATQDGDKVTVIAETDPDGKADITVSVPANCTFSLSTGNGDVTATGLNASGIVSSGNGDAVLEVIQGDIQVHVGNGDITLVDVEGSALVTDGNGDIALQGAKGSFALDNGNGKIDFQGELVAGSENSFSLGNGPVTVELLGTPSVALTLETPNGDVIRDLQITVQEMTDELLVGTIGDGEASLSVRTGNGDITIK